MVTELLINPLAVAIAFIVVGPATIMGAVYRVEEIVGEALDGLPPDLGRLMRNVAVVVELDTGPSGLLGLYRGIPLTQRTSRRSTWSAS